MINILDIKPSVISRDLRGKYICIYSLPKAGKTTLASKFPNALLCAFEAGYNAISGIKPADILKWKDFKDVVKQLETPEAQKMYDTIIIDTVSIAWDMCTDYICAREGVDKIGDIPFGSGYDMVKKEFEKTMRKVTQLGYGIVIIAHSSIRQEQGVDGSTIEMIAPDIPKRCYDVVNRMVDIIAYIGIDEEGERWLYTRKTPRIMAGSRFAYMAPKIKLGYKELVDAVCDAIDQEEKNGGVVVDKKDAPLIEEPPVNFKEVRTEIGKIVKVLSKLDESEVDPHFMADYKKIAEGYIGKGRLVKDCDESQVDFLVQILDDLKEYIKTNNIQM